MPKLPGKIPKRAFELVRDQIGAILADEFTGQYEPGEVKPTVYVGRQVPYDKADGTIVNIRTGTGSYDNENLRSSDGTYLYFIDVYTTSGSTRDQDGNIVDGDIKSREDIEHLTGLIWAILKNPIYRTLAFAPPFISNVTIGSFVIAEYEIKDTESTTCARLECTVRVPENHTLIPPVLLIDSITTVKLAYTNKGYKYQYLDPANYFVSETGSMFTSEQGQFFTLES